MKVSDLIAELSRDYDADAEIFVAYWDKDTANDYGISRELTADEWVDVVRSLERGEFSWQSDAAETIVDVAEDVISESDN